MSYIIIIRYTLIPIDDSNNLLRSVNPNYPLMIAVGLVFLVIFGSLLFIQFLCMIIHRMSTWMHMIARAPDKCGDPYNASWAFKDTDFRRTEETEDAEDLEARREREEINRRMLQRFQERAILRHVSFTDHPSEERQPLIPVSATNPRMRQLTPNYSSVNIV